MRKMLQELQLVPGENNYVVVSAGCPSSTVARNYADNRTIAIAPAPEKNYVTHDSPPNFQYRKKVHFKTNPCTGPQSASIARRNARERNRVKQVNDGFNTLRRHLPSTVIAALSGGAKRGSGKKLSKVDTLKMVVEYIRYLEKQIEETDETLSSVCDHENRENIPNSQKIQRTYEDGFYYGNDCPSSIKSGSPTPSECSSEVSSAYSSQQLLGPMDEDELLDVISWWQEKQ